MRVTFTHWYNKRGPRYIGLAAFEALFAGGRTRRPHNSTADDLVYNSYQTQAIPPRNLVRRSGTLNPSAPRLNSMAVSVPVCLRQPWPDPHASHTATIASHRGRYRVTQQSLTAAMGRSYPVMTGSSLHL